MHMRRHLLWILTLLWALALVHPCEAAPRRVILIGASVGEAWNFPQLPARVKNPAFVLEYVGQYDFDKSEPLRKVLGRTQKKPDAVILKECAAYFPGDLTQYRAQVKQWVAACRKANVKPILATVCPVTQQGDQLKGLLAYNDWVRNYAASEHLPVLDLEAALRRSPIDRRLDPRYADSDGLHLVQAGYRRLDPIVIPVLAATFR